MKSESTLHDNDTIDILPFKEKLRKKLPPDSPVLIDLLGEPDSMLVRKAEILIPHYIERLERELERYEARGPLVLRS